MFELDRRADFLIFKKSPEAEGAAVFLIDDFWRAVGDLADDHGGLTLDHATMSHIVYRETLSPNAAITGLSAWKFAAHPGVARVFAGRFLTENCDWIGNLLAQDRSLLESLFFVDHQDINRVENAAYDSIKLLLQSSVPNHRIFSFTVGSWSEVSNRLFKDFGIQREQEIGKYELEARPVEVIDQVFDFVSSHCP